MRDVTNKLACVCTFMEDSRKSITKLASAFTGLWGSKSATTPTDHFEVKITQISIHHYNDNNDKIQEITRGEGSWLESIEIDGQVIWNILTRPRTRWLELEQKLHSDSTFRPDLQYLIQRDFENAQM
mgnify:CR=1 FL=1